MNENFKQICFLSVLQKVFIVPNYFIQRGRFQILGTATVKVCLPTQSKVFGTISCSTGDATNNWHH